MLSLSEVEMMTWIRGVLVLLAAGCLLRPATADAQAVSMSEAAQIAAATAPLPQEFRADATVLGYRAGGSGLVPLRQGTGAYICLATDPAQPSRFHVACYHRSLEPFMARGRALRAQGRGEEVDAVREAEAKAGTLKMPDGPAALYSLTGTPEHVDATTGTVTGARPLYVVYIPFATAASSGLPTTPAPGMPWLMNPGTAKAHIMFVPVM
jgi:hypothetical protein